MKSIFVYILMLLVAWPLFAQVEDEYYEMEEMAEDYMESAPIEEPYYEEFEEAEMEPPPPPPNNIRSDLDSGNNDDSGGNERVIPMNRRANPIPRMNRNRSASTGSSGGYGATSGDIEFKLVDPPQYWVGEKRPEIPRRPE